MYIFSEKLSTHYRNRTEHFVHLWQVQIHHNVNVTWQMHSGTDLSSSDDVQKTLTHIAFLSRLDLTGSCK